MTLKTTPLFAAHEKLGATFTDFNGWNMPLKYSSEMTEHKAVRQAVGIFDLSHMGEVFLSGPDAVKGLNTALAGDFSKMSVGRAKYTVMLTEDGTILDDLIVYRLGEDRYLMVPNAGNAPAVAEAVVARTEGMDLTVDDATADLSLVGIQGPKAADVVAALGEDFAEAAASLTNYRVTEILVNGNDWIVARTGYTGEDGFEIITPNADIAQLWEQIFSLDIGVEITPCGLASRDSLRLEAGMPLYGNELSTERTPFEAGMGRIVSFEKPENFVGRTALEALREHTPQQVLIGLTSDQRRAARSGSEIVVDGKTVGVITSGIPSPTLSKPVALGYIDAAHADVDTEVSVDIRGKALPFVITKPPFYSR
ncbi:glycine cleavage system aminomethyltransferase GcvT [Enteractinococcus helveticum]|uniref:Aminomethyltransferase n=1 Tax=Enteractinococcus helveticum TaxID=1837282 RepID=A0A1B7LWF9_9MICC|nr:glycine cleavage system aminomethyltransferase GcvT [Enteractinococcus helveticum]OAV59358.1 glycine cleavage system protein T [Enteractinococcus helveticum]